MRIHDEEIGEEVFLDEDAKILSRIRRKPKKKSINILNKPQLSQREMDELFAEA